ncbi:aldo/keto reductase [Vagococcus xieshaowenii]|uniref:Aldo/keto reductase family oxidoreductase n=1 Tax=Vagococcus xieshaowenii TaxID=2562451 RepID=A0AAJ5EE77_9ENTE|nr:aldo/keto reductase [Vagococcus xieshaowenii]QCA29073.1 aldo/keto reductase family oxidoreductase [Vagococcus xieshaowenii]TFZ40951.1 aldo/keto reductase family oxidoreductase [Vagococcus xieshaowenii]
MKSILLGKQEEMNVSQIGIGCMRMAQLTEQQVVSYLEHTHELGINFYDHADIYGQGACETIFGKALKQTSFNREDIMIQSKCGIRSGFFDFSKEHILSSVDNILTRLDVDYLDVLALHRPDALMEPEEVTEAFVELRESGKVRHFGVSNQNPMQIELLKKSLNPQGIDLLVNQLQMSLMFTPMIDQGFNVNMKNEGAVMRDGSLIEYSRLNDMTIQAWSPFQYGFFEGAFVDNPKFPELNNTLEEIAQKYGVSKTGLAIAWLSRHPANIQTIIGTMNSQRVSEVAEASGITLSREDWYALYRAAGNILP